MPVPSSLADLSTTPASNSPAGSESPALVDDYLRTHGAFIKQVDNAAAKSATLAASGGSALVGYMPSGTGAVATTVQAKLREGVSVTDKGADATGAVDASNSFLAAYAESPSYYIPPGTYVITSATVNVDAHQFFSAAGVTLVIDGVSKDYSNCFFGAYQLIKNGDWVSGTQKYLNIVNRFSGQTLARISSAYSSSDSHQFYLPIEVVRDSHGFMLRHGTVGGNSDVLFQDSTSEDLFYLQSTGDAASCAFNILFDSTPGVAGGFDTAFSIVNVAGVATGLFPAIPVEFQLSAAFRKRSGATYKWRMVPDTTTMALKSQDTSDVDQATLMSFGRYDISTGNKRTGVYPALPFTGRFANSFSESGSISTGASRTFPLVGASQLAIGTVNVVFVGSGGGSRYYQADFKFDGTTLTTDASTLNSGDAQLAVTFSVVSSQLELTLNYTGGFGGSARYAVDVDVATVNR